MDTSNETHVNSETESLEKRQRKMTEKGLELSIDNSVKNMVTVSRTLTQCVKNLENDFESMQPLIVAIEEATVSNRNFNECWDKLFSLYKLDTEGLFVESFDKSRNEYYALNLRAAEVIDRAHKRLNEFQLETMTAITGGSKVSRISASSTVQTAKAKAVAQSVAANERLHFIEEIAKKKAELEILKARQEAAEAAAVVEALSETNGSLRSGCDKFIPQTSPNDTANDHAQRFREKQHAAEKESSNPQIGDKLASNLQVKEEIQGKSGINFPTLPETIPNTVQSLAEAMSSAISLNKIPAPEPGIFRGDPLSYPDWRISVRTLLEENAYQSQTGSIILRNT